LWPRPAFDSAGSDEFLGIEGRLLTAIRTDIRQSGDSILTEIIDGIAHSQLVLADISTKTRWRESQTVQTARNSNVLMEVGLALACRQPVELILVRDDDDPLIFDLSHIPVLRLDSSDIDNSVKIGMEPTVQNITILAKSRARPAYQSRMLRIASKLPLNQRRAYVRF
jgi:hypothetical protein